MFHCGSGRAKLVLGGLQSLLAIGLVQALLTVGAAAQTSDWTGGWDSVWRDGGTALYLEQSGNIVTGRYPTLEGRLIGEARGRVLSGSWQDANGEGSFVFALSPDGTSFMGRFGDGEWWTGQRMPDNQEFSLGVDASSPRSALRTLLLSGNLASSNSYDDLAAALSVLDFSELDDDETDNAFERLDLARTLFRVLDGLTFRLWMVPDEGEDGQAEVELDQAGTDVSFVLRFRYRVRPDGAGGWFIIVPPMEQLEEMLRRLSDARPADPGGPSTAPLRSPRDTMRTFLDGYQDWVELDDPTAMLSTLDLEAIPHASRHTEGLHRAEYLKGVIDRVGYVIWQEIPDDPARPDIFTHFAHPSGRIEIAPSENEDEERVWRFSTSSVEVLPELFVAMEDMPVASGIEADVRSNFLHIRRHIRALDRDLLDRYWRVELWQWIAVAILLVSALIVGWLTIFLLRRLARSLKSGDEEAPERGLSTIIRPLGITIGAGLVLVTTALLWLPARIGIPLSMSAGIVAVLGAGWLIFNLIGVVGHHISNPTGRIRSMDELSRSVIISLAKIAVVIGTVLALAEVVGLPYEGVLAGLGIGGFAVALAARSTLENFIGGLTLLADKPVRAGDFCRFGDNIGTVEALGLRSIKIRSLDRTLFTIPNAEFINLYIENFAKRDSILLKTILTLRYETTPDQMRWVLAQIRRMLIQHPKVTETPSRARFVEFGSHSLDIEIFAYIDTSDFNEYLAIREDINLRLADIVEASGTSFAFPSVVNYVARDGGVDSERTAEVERAVSVWRNDDRLPFPEFDNTERWEMYNALDYPGPGSPDSKAARERKAETPD